MTTAVCPSSCRPAPPDVLLVVVVVDVVTSTKGGRTVPNGASMDDSKGVKFAIMHASCGSCGESC